VSETVYANLLFTTLNMDCSVLSFVWAQHYAPSTIFFDKIDGLCSSREETDSGVTYRIKNLILQETVRTALICFEHGLQCVIICMGTTLCTQYDFLRQNRRPVFKSGRN